MVKVWILIYDNGGWDSIPSISGVYGSEEAALAAKKVRKDLYGYEIEEWEVED